MQQILFKKINKYYFDPASPIGKGAFGTVYLAYDETNQDARLAVKRIKITDIIDDATEREMVLREIEVLRQIEGEHLVQLVDLYRTANNLYIFMEYCEGGDLDTKIEKNQEFSEEEACSIIKQVAKAFIDLNELEVNPPSSPNSTPNSSRSKICLMHRDIKPANILFKNGKVKLADFGLAKIIDKIDENVQLAHTAVGTPLFCPPQILKGNRFNAKCDVWSAGVVFYLLIFNRLPWEAKSLEDLLHNILTQPLEFPDNIKIKNETQGLIQRMLQIEEDDRASWNEVFEHPALQNCNI